MKHFNLILGLNFALAFLFLSCDHSKETDDCGEVKIIRDTVLVYQSTIDTIEVPLRLKNEELSYYIHERLPSWFAYGDLLKDTIVAKHYVFDNRLNPLYLEDDFNGDGHYDLAIPIRRIRSNKVGFAIIHGESNEVHIVGAGKHIKNSISDDMNYIDIWRVNRLKQNEPGLDETGDLNPEGKLMLENPSISIEKSELGGGLIYWNGEEYVYFHQTC